MKSGDSTGSDSRSRRLCAGLDRTAFLVFIQRTLGYHDRVGNVVSMDLIPHLENETPGTRIVTDCEICGATEFLDVAAGSAVLCPIKMCQTCGHFFTSPCIDSDDMAQFYLEEFAGDAGANYS